MFYTEINKDSEIVLSQITEDPDNHKLLDDSNRLVEDEIPPYDGKQQAPERVEPVTGNYVIYRFIPTGNKPIKIDEDLVVAKIHANEFLKTIANNEEPLWYIVTVYNTSLGKDIFNIFGNDNFHVKLKVDTNEVEEYYRVGEVIKGVKHPFVAYDKDTNEITGHYRMFNNGLEKTPTDDSVENARIVYGGFNTIPKTLTHMLKGFKYRHSIETWSLKQYGFIIEYRR